MIANFYISFIAIIEVIIFVNEAIYRFLLYLLPARIEKGEAFTRIQDFAEIFGNYYGTFVTGKEINFYKEISYFELIVA